MLLIERLGTNLGEILSKFIHILIPETAFENVVWKMAAILSQPQYVRFNLSYARTTIPQPRNIFLSSDTGTVFGHWEDPVLKVEWLKKL